MTIRTTAHFTIREDALDEVLPAISTFVAHTANEPGTLRYESWRSDEEPTRFLHVMEFVDADAERAHATSDAVKAFTAVVYPFCTEPPVFTSWTLHDDDR